MRGCVKRRTGGRQRRLRAAVKLRLWRRCPIIPKKERKKNHTHWLSDDEYNPAGGQKEQHTEKEIMENHVVSNATHRQREL